MSTCLQAIAEYAAAAASGASCVPFAMQLLEHKPVLALAALSVFPSVFSAEAAAEVMARADKPHEARQLLSSFYSMGLLQYTFIRKEWSLKESIKQAAVQMVPKEVSAAEMRYIQYNAGYLQRMSLAYYTSADWRKALDMARAAAVDIVCMTRLAAKTKAAATLLGAALSPAVVSLLTAADSWRTFETERSAAVLTLLGFSYQAASVPAVNNQAFLQSVGSVPAAVFADALTPHLLAAVVSTHATPVCNLLICSGCPPELTLDACKQLLGIGHAITAWACTSAASVLRAQGRMADAEPMQRNALALRSLALGADHPDTLASMNLVAISSEEVYGG